MIASAALHDVIDSDTTVFDRPTHHKQRISGPQFFNPTHDTVVAPPGSGEMIKAAEHTARRLAETYVYLKGEKAEIV